MKREDLTRIPVKHLDLSRIKNIAELVEAFHYTSFQSRALAHCFDVYKNMLEDKKRVTILFGLSGAMVPAGMRKVIADMIKNKLIDVLVSTGANLYHDFVEAFGSAHFIGSPNIDDIKLRELDIDRIYDTFADEKKFKPLDHKIAALVDSMEPRAYSTREFLEILGNVVKDKNSILCAAAKNRVPVFCPAINDSSIGISLAEHYLRKKRKKEAYVTIDPIKDIHEIALIKKKSQKTGVVYIGGGTPKNYIQQIEIVLEMLGYNTTGREGHDYALQITTDMPCWGGLSGCTFEEAQSWGKIARNATKATAYLDATIGLPLLAGAVMQNCKAAIKRRRRLRFNWQDTELKIE